jgi:hypothetical protein
MVKQAPWAPMPQQASSAPVRPSTASVPPFARPEQQLDFSVSQKPPLAQSVLEAQVVVQAFAPQMNGVQGVATGGEQLPPPSHSGMANSISPLQLPASPQRVVWLG